MSRSRFSRPRAVSDSETLPQPHSPRRQTMPARAMRGGADSLAGGAPPHQDRNQPRQRAQPKAPPPTRDHRASRQAFGPSPCDRAVSVTQARRDSRATAACEQRPGGRRRRIFLYRREARLRSAARLGQPALYSPRRPAARRSAPRRVVRRLDGGGAWRG